MKILIGHNRYQWAGGEDAVVATERNLLEAAGHEVYLFEANNDNFLRPQGLKRIAVAKDLFWSAPSYQRLRQAIRSFKPDIAHFHNIYFALTPAVYHACHDEGVAVVQSLHNFRMICANGLLFRDQHPCEDCLVKSPMEGIKHRCYKNSTLASGAVTAITFYHRWQGTWVNKVDRYITATEFTRGKYIQAGLPPEKMMVKPNVYIPQGGFKKPRGEFALYVGRLSREKGVLQLLEAWEQLPDIPLKLMGDGPLIGQLKLLAAQAGLSNVEFLGHTDEQQYTHYMQGAKFLVLPSQCYENFPRITVEAFAFGLPILASRLGSLVEIIDDGRTGFLFDPLNVKELAVKARQLWVEDTAALSANARQAFECRFSPQRNLEQLLHIYESAIAQRKSAARKPLLAGWDFYFLFITGVYIVWRLSLYLHR